MLRNAQKPLKTLGSKKIQIYTGFSVVQINEQIVELPTKMANGGFGRCSRDFLSPQWAQCNRDLVFGPYRWQAKHVKGILGQPSNSLHAQRHLVWTAMESQAKQPSGVTSNMKRMLWFPSLVN